MPLIKGNFSPKKIKISAKIRIDLLKEMNQYCQWANIDDIDFFIEKSAEYMLKKGKKHKGQPLLQC